MPSAICYLLSANIQYSPMPEDTQNPLPNLILMYGEDTFSIHEKINLWKQEFEKKYGGDINIAELAGEEVSPTDIIDSIEALPFLSEKRLVIIKNFLSEKKADEQKKLAEKLKDVPETTVLIFYEISPPDKRLTLFKHLQKLATLKEFQPLKGTALNQWIINHTAKKGGQIGILAASYLAEHIGPNLWQLSNEIQKLSLYTGSQEIQAKDIDLLTKTSAEANIFKLTDQIGRRQIKEALKTLHELIETGSEPPYVFAMIARQFRLLIQIKDLIRKGFDKQQIANRLKQHPFVVTNIMNQARNFEGEALKRTHQKLLELDTKFKSGKIHYLASSKKHYLLQVEKLIAET